MANSFLYESADPVEFQSNSIDYTRANGRTAEQLANFDYSTMDTDKVEATVAKLAGDISSFSGEIPTLASEACFTTLSDAGFSNAFPTSFDANIAALISALESSEQSIRSILTNMIVQDQQVETEVDETAQQKKRKRSGGGSGQRQEEAFGEFVLDNSTEQFAEYENMSMENLAEVAAILNKLAEDNNVSLDQLLTNEDYADVIKQALQSAESNPLSDNLKSLIEAGSSTVSQKVLLSIFNGEQSKIAGLDTDTENTLKVYLTQIATENNLSVEQLLTDDANSTLLKKSLSEFKGVYGSLTPAEGTVRDSLLAIYDGSNQEAVSASTQGIIRNYVDNVATSNNSSYEALLSDDSDLLSSKVSALGKLSIILENASKFNEGTSSVLNNLLKISSGTAGVVK